MKTLLSAKLAEGRILIVDNDDLPERKTKHVSEMISNFTSKDRVLYITGQKNADFSVASRNLEQLTYTTFNEARLTDILKHDTIMFNLDGILSIMKYLHEQTVMLHKPRAVPFNPPLLTELKTIKAQKEGRLPVEKVTLIEEASV